MSLTSLQHKTVRPGSLVGYSYYHSNRRTAAAAPPAAPAFKLNSHRKRHLILWAILTVAVVAVILLGPIIKGASKSISTTSNSGNLPAAGNSLQSPNSAPAATAPSEVTNHCVGNNGDQLIIVSVSQRHLWACQNGEAIYNTPVVTGIETLAADLTPRGTFHISSKTTNTTLTGTDTTGSWSDPVSYWLPFLHNRYGTYGFHDATWRANSDFGKIDPNSRDASHGCVELPLTGAQWLYNWAHVGATVTIKD
ncbi:MAG TPA: L,D-transpeptidase [Candidatus Saccharimonadales bacterium]|nr:L,D-transpeptidase [Candidatus Saccharimonadales bacterium]